MIVKYEEYLKDINVYIINRINAEVEKEELINELLGKFKLELFVPIKDLREVWELLVEFAYLSKEIWREDD